MRALLPAEQSITRWDVLGPQNSSAYVQQPISTPRLQTPGYTGVLTPQIPLGASSYGPQEVGAAALPQTTEQQIYMLAPGALPQAILSTPGAQPDLAKLGMQPLSAESLEAGESPKMRPQYSSLFGLLNTSAGEQLERQMDQANQNAAAEANEAAPAAQGPQPPQYGAEAAALKGQSAQEPNAQPAQEQEKEGQEPQGTFTRFAAPSPLGKEKPKLEDDVFANVLKKLAKSGRMEPARPAASQPQLPEPGISSERTDLESLEISPAQRRALNQDNVSLVVPADRHIVVDHLGGSGDDIFNQIMRQGDKALHTGQFYQAATRYESAAVLRRDNPLPLAGAAVAYLGAGESFAPASCSRRSCACTRRCCACG